MTKMALVAAAAAMLIAVPSAQAQQQQEGLVNIALDDTSPTIAVPIGIAAQVCGVDVGVIQDARDKNTAVKCDQGDINNPVLQNFINSNAGGNQNSNAGGNQNAGGNNKK